MEKVSFFVLLKHAFRRSLTDRGLWFFGFFVALATVSQNFFLTPTTATLATTWSDLFLPENSTALYSWILLTLLLFIVGTFGKSNLIVALAVHPKKRSFLAILKPFSRALLLEACIFSFFIVVILLLALPPFLAKLYSPESFGVLLIASLVIFLPVVILVYFTREFAFFYLLLAHLSIRTALENSYTLFIRCIRQSLSFGIFFLFLTLSFTFFLNLILLSTGKFLEKIGGITFQSEALFVVSLLVLTWFSVLGQTLWFVFFKALATPPEITSLAKENTKVTVLTKDKIPDSPLA